MIIFLYGADTFRSREKLNELKRKFRREVDPSGDSLITIEGETADVSKIDRHISSPSLFVRKRMAVIENIFANKNKDVVAGLHDYLKSKEAKPNDNIIIFWDEAAKGNNKLFKYLKEQKFSYEFAPLSNTETMNWIKNEAEAQGASIGRQAITSLTAIFGSDLWSLKNELDKLINYKKGELSFSLAEKTISDKNIASASRVSIDENDIKELCRGKTDENIFALTDALSARQKGKALELMEKEIGNGMNENYLLFMIIRQFRILLLVRQALDLGYTQRKLAADLKLHPFVAQKSAGQAHYYSLKSLSAIFSSLVKIDRRSKTGISDIKTDLGLLIANM
jgi:DNA polymerase III subunit delta